jgi:hypothetical protein
VTGRITPKADQYEYRLGFATILAFSAAAREQLDGPNVWLTLTETEWDALPWGDPVVQVRRPKHEREVMAQYEVLCDWAKTHEQPIRDVRLERRRVLDGLTAQWEVMP